MSTTFRRNRPERRQSLAAAVEPLETRLLLTRYYDFSLASEYQYTNPTRAPRSKACT
jgi:hypothetical protein